MNDANEESDFLKLAIKWGLPSKEEFFKRQMTQVKKENNSNWSEDTTEELLKIIAFPEFHRVDGNPTYEAEIKRRIKNKNLPPMLTPDFVVGAEPIEANDPENFYIDVNEITEGIWGNFDDEKNKFPRGNPIKKMYQEMNCEDFTSDKPYRLLISEIQQDIVNSLYKQIISKSEKYSSKRDGSNKFGLVSILAKDGVDIAKIQYLKLITSIFDDMLIPFFFENSTPEVCEQLRSIKLIFLNIGHKAGFVPIVCPFEGDWCFWIIAATSAHEGDCLCLVNSTVLNSLPADNPVAIWIKDMLKMAEPTGEYA